MAYVHKQRFWPVEVKWTEQLRVQELTQIVKYPNGKVWAKVKKPTFFQDLPIQPLPQALFQLGEETTGSSLER